MKSKAAMKSALCLLSGKSCARLIEMFIRQIYRDGKEEGGAGGTAGSGCAQQARQRLLGGDLRPAQKEQEWGPEQVGDACEERGHSSDSQRTAEGRGMPAELLSL